MTTHFIRRILFSLSLGVILLWLVLSQMAAIRPVAAKEVKRNTLNAIELDHEAPSPLSIPLTHFKIPPPAIPHQQAFNCQAQFFHITETETNIQNSQPSLSNNGQTLALISNGNLAGDTCGNNPEIFLYNRSSKSFTEVANSCADTFDEPSLSGQENFVAFWSTFFNNGQNPDSNSEIFLYDIVNKALTQVTNSQGSIAGGFNFSPSSSDDGNRVAFFSTADLIPGTNPELNAEIFWYQRVPPALTQVTKTDLTAVNNEPAISGDGNYIAYTFNGKIKVYTITSQSTMPVATGITGTHSQPAISDDGNRIAFVSNQNGNQRVFLYDRPTGSATLLANTPAGINNNQPAISGNGQRIAFVSNGNLDATINNSDGNPEVFLYDVTANKIIQFTNTPTATNAAPSLDFLGNQVALASNGDLVSTKNPESNQEIFLGECAFTDLELSKISQPTSVKPGQSFAYILTLKNNGTTTVNNIVLIDTFLPTNLFFAGLTPVQAGAGGICTPAVVSGDPVGPVTCNFASLAPKQEATVIIMVSSPLPGTFVNQAAITGFTQPVPAEQFEANNVATATTLVGPIDLSVSKSASTDLALVGQPFSYTITIRNNEPIPPPPPPPNPPPPPDPNTIAKGVKIIDTLPAGVNLILPDTKPVIVEDDFDGNPPLSTLWTIKVSDKSGSGVIQGTGVAEFVGGGFLISQLQHKPSASGILHITGKWTFTDGGNDRLQILTRSDGVTQTNSGAVEIANGIEFFIEHGSSSTGDQLGIRRRNGGMATPLAMLTPAPPTELIAPDQAINFEVIDDGQNLTFIVTNPTASISRMLTATDNFSFSLNHIVFHNRSDTANSKTSLLDEVRIEIPPPSGCTRNGLILTCARNNLSPGQQDTLTLVVSPTVAAGILITNHVEVDSIAPDDQPDNSEDDLLTNVRATGLTLAKSVFPASIRKGEPLKYTLVVTNNDDKTATGVLLTDVLPASVDFVSAAGCTHNNGLVTCNLNTIVASGTKTVNIQVTAKEAGTLLNTATVQGNEPDSNPADNTDTATALVDAIDLQVTKSASDNTPAVGQSFTYTIVTKNNGPLLATAVTMTDILPTPLNFISVAANQGSCSQASGSIVCPFGPLDNQASTTVTVVVSPTLTGTVVNTANVVGVEPDPDLSNNAGGATVVVGGVDDPTPDLTQKIYLPLIMK